MASVCVICFNLEKKSEYDRRLTLEFKPDELQVSAGNRKCPSCALLLSGILCISRGGTWDLFSDVSLVYGYALAADDETLYLELYFHDQSRPKFSLEFFSSDILDCRSSALAHIASPHLPGVHRF
jgi:hypothetical protein